MDEKNKGRRVVVVKNHVIAPPEPKKKTVKARKIGDYPGVPKVYLDAASKLASPLLMGPPICDELVAYVEHLFTEEEADLFRHLTPLRSKTANQLARDTGRPLAEVEVVLASLAVEKHCILGLGKESRKHYRPLPVVPGIFEMVMIGQDPEDLSEWHRRFIELFEALFETGYWLEYQEVGATPFIRYLPIGESIQANSMALPSDKLEPILDRYDSFGVGQCQCRMAAQVQGEGCGKPISNCSTFGEWADIGISDGWLKRVSRKDMLEIKREAESHGLVTWMMNAEHGKSQASCSCCGCCCHGFRMVNEFDAPNAIAPPHFMPKFDMSKCTYCGKCALNCPMGALTIDTKGKTMKHLVQRCIGCGLCAIACEKEKAVSMEPVSEYRPPFKNWYRMLASFVPGTLKTTFKVWRSR